MRRGLLASVSVAHAGDYQTARRFEHLFSRDHAPVGRRIAPRRLDAGGSRESRQLCAVCRRGAPAAVAVHCRGTSPVGTSSERRTSLVARPRVLTPLTLWPGPASNEARSRPSLPPSGELGGERRILPEPDLMGPNPERPGPSQTRARGASGKSEKSAVRSHSDLIPQRSGGEDPAYRRYQSDECSGLQNRRFQVRVLGAPLASGRLNRQKPPAQTPIPLVSLQRATLDHELPRLGNRAVREILTIANGSHDGGIG
jgi:hypothetical protein